VALQRLERDLESGNRADLLDSLEREIHKPPSEA
jgi:hypothetical protein